MASDSRSAPTGRADRPFRPAKAPTASKNGPGRRPGGKTAGQAEPALLLNAVGAASLCGVSRSMWWSLHSAGLVPLPIRLRGRTLWRRDELLDWTRADCPPRDRWEAMKKVRR